MRHNTLILLALLCGVCAVCGCGHADYQEILAAYGSHLDPAVAEGAGEQAVVRGWGLPDQKETIGDAEFWVYFRNVRGVANGHGYTDALGITRVSAESAKQYDKIVMEFHGGILVGWHGEIRR